MFCNACMYWIGDDAWIHQHSQRTFCFTYDHSGRKCLSFPVYSDTVENDCWLYPGCSKSPFSVHVTGWPPDICGRKTKLDRIRRNSNSEIPFWGDDEQYWMRLFLFGDGQPNNSRHLMEFVQHFPRSRAQLVFVLLNEYGCRDLDTHRVSFFFVVVFHGIVSGYCGCLFHLFYGQSGRGCLK